MMHPFPLPRRYPSSGLSCGRVLPPVLCTNKTANPATRSHREYFTLTPKTCDRTVIARSYKLPVSLIPPAPAIALWFTSGHTPECGRVMPLFQLTPTETHNLEMIQVRGRVTPIFHLTTTKTYNLEIAQARGRVAPVFHLTPTETHNLEMAQARGRVTPIFHPTATKTHNLEMMQVRGRVMLLFQLTPTETHSLEITQARGRVRQTCHSAKRQSPHLDSAFFNYVSSIGGLAPQTTSVSTTILCGRYPEWYQGGTGRYQKAVPGDTRRYWQLPKAVPAQYRAVRRYHLGITFSPVPPGRYPVPGQKVGDTGAVRAVGIAQTGITSIILASLTANAVHEVKTQRLLRGLGLHSQTRTVAVQEVIRRGAGMNPMNGVGFEVNNEQGVVVYFAQQGANHGFHFESVQTAFPDAIIWHKGVRYRVEFEYQAKSFLHHQHDPRGCDLIICWHNDYSDSILPVLALSDPNWPETPLVLPDAVTRELTYWRERALSVERQLKRHQLSTQQAPQGQRIRPRIIQTVTANQKATILAWHLQGLTEYEIGQQVFGQDNERTRRWIRFVLETINTADDNKPGTKIRCLCPFPSERPPTPEEQVYIRQLFALGFSRNRICSAVYGFKNTKILGWINDALAELDEEDDEEETPLERITA